MARGSLEGHRRQHDVPVHHRIALEPHPAPRLEVLGPDAMSQKAKNPPPRGQSSDVGPPVVPFYRSFFGGGFHPKVGYRKKGTLMLTSLLEDLATQTKLQRAHTACALECSFVELEPLWHNPNRKRGRGTSSVDSMCSMSAMVSPGPWRKSAAGMHVCMSPAQSRFPRCPSIRRVLSSIKHRDRC